MTIIKIKKEENNEKEKRSDRFSYKPRNLNRFGEKDNNDNLDKDENVKEKTTTNTFKSKYSPYTCKSTTTRTTTTTTTIVKGKSFGK